MKKMIAFAMLLLACGCAHVLLTVINATDKPIKNVQIKLNEDLTMVPELAPGSAHQQSLKVKKPISININYQDADGHEFFTSSSQMLHPGDGGSLRLSVTAKGTLDAVRIP